MKTNYVKRTQKYYRKSIKQQIDENPTAFVNLYVVSLGLGGATFLDPREDLNYFKKIFIHQANEKMDHAIVKRFYKLYGYKDIPDKAMPMSIHYLGNSSVATVPTLYDLVKKNQLDDHELKEGDLIMFASVGAGMHVNAITYRV